MLTPEELQARRRAAVKEAKHSVPVVGIVVAVVVFGGIGYFGLQWWQEQQKAPGPVAVHYIQAMQKEDWATVKAMATRESAAGLDMMAAQFKLPANDSRVKGFKELTFTVDKVTIERGKAIVVLRKGYVAKAQLLDSCTFVLAPAGDTWRVDEIASNRLQQGPNSRFP